ncbi:hypothetical protein [Halomonas sp. B23F22_10]
MTLNDMPAAEFYVEKYVAAYCSHNTEEICLVYWVLLGLNFLEISVSTG